MSAVFEKMMRITLILLIISACSVFCFPAKPLNERSTELAWQAWLLVDDQNQSQKQNDSQGLRRRITPKSVFIAPTFSPDNFPACAEGYRSDPMGRCIKIIKLDEDAHLDFLLQKLNAKFGDNDYEDDSGDEDTATAGPFQFSIPLDGGSGSSNTEEEGGGGDTDMAIVLAPTSAGLDGSMKIDVNKQNETETKDGNTVNVNTIAHILGVRQEDVETTTILETTTATEATTQDENNSNASRENTEDASSAESTDSTTSKRFTDSTTILPETATAEGEALFYLNPTEQIQNTFEPQTDDVMMNDEGSGTMTTSDNTQATTTTAFEQSTLPLTTTSEDTTSENHHLVKFPEDNLAQSSSSDLVRFPSSSPNDNSSPEEYPERYHGTRDTIRHHQDVLFDDYSHERPLDERPEFFQSSFLDDENFHRSYESSTPHPARHAYNHRSREKHNDLFILPPSIRDGSYSSQQKPLVLRFSRKRGYIDMNNLRNPELYRQVTSEDLSHLFGIRQRDFDHR